MSVDQYDIKFSINEDAVPSININGDETSVVNCSYHYVTTNGTTNSLNHIVATVLLPNSIKQVTVYYNSLTTECFVQ